jgi:hypothetical protein
MMFVIGEAVVLLFYIFLWFHMVEGENVDKPVFEYYCSCTLDSCILTFTNQYALRSFTANVKKPFIQLHIACC